MRLVLAFLFACGAGATAPVANHTTAVTSAESVEQILRGMAAAYAHLATFAEDGSIKTVAEAHGDVRGDMQFHTASVARGAFRMESGGAIAWSDGNRSRLVVGSLEIPLVDRPMNLATDDFEQLTLKQWAEGDSELMHLTNPRLVGVEPRDGASCWHVTGNAGRFDVWIDQRDHRVREVITRVDGTELDTEKLMYDAHFRVAAHPISTAEPPPAQPVP